MSRLLRRFAYAFLIAIGVVLAAACLRSSAWAKSARAPIAQPSPAPAKPPPGAATRQPSDARNPRAPVDRRRDASDAPVAAQQSRQTIDPRATAQRRRELDDLQREDVASQLALLGIPLKWQDHPLAELTDWRDRIEAAVTLRVQYRVDVDWRVTSLRDLIDMRLRAAKASELSSLHGVRVDWRRYSWVALEAMRRQMTRMPSNNSAAAFAADALAVPGSVGRARRPGVRPRDPDAIIEPTFAFDNPLIWSRPFGRGGKPDPDAILVPRFVTVPSSPNNRD